MIARLVSGEREPKPFGYKTLNPSRDPPTQSHTSSVRIWEVDSPWYHFLISAPGSAYPPPSGLRASSLSSHLPALSENSSLSVESSQDSWPFLSVPNHSQIIPSLLRLSSPKAVSVMALRIMNIACTVCFSLNPFSLPVIRHVSD